MRFITYPIITILVAMWAVPYVLSAWISRFALYPLGIDLTRFYPNHGESVIERLTKNTEN